MDIIGLPKENNKEVIRTWWRRMSLKKRNIQSDKPAKVPNKESRTIFGVPLNASLAAASASVAFVNDNGQYVVGNIPIIVSKCGGFLKDQGLYSEGIFRMSGSTRRIGELQRIFSTPLEYGSQLDWEGFSVHDAASVLKRYLNSLSEPVIIRRLYQPFREVTVLQSTDQAKVHAYQQLISDLPIENQYLLFYLLDLLSIFARHAQTTKMDIFNLASVFTPSILLDPDHAMEPTHYKASQKVVHFLIEHRHNFALVRYKHNWNSNNFSNSTNAYLPGTRASHDIMSLKEQRFHGFPGNANDTIPISEENTLNRANTVPAKKVRYGVDDPLQIVQHNKLVS